MNKGIVLTIAGIILFTQFVLGAIQIEDVSTSTEKIINLQSPNINTLLGLTDTPSSYTGADGYCLKVNETSGSVFFGTCEVGAGGDITSVLAGIGLTGGGLEGSVTLNLNTTYTDESYAGIEWDYNQTTPANTYTDTVNASQSTWIENTFLSIANALIQYFNKTDIIAQYYNRSDIDSFNASWTSTYNSTYAGSVNNASYLSTYNSTYANILNQQCSAGYVVNGTLANGTFTCVEDQTGAGEDNGYFFNVTTGTHTGNLSYEGYIGYEAGNEICDSNFTGTHLCSQEEVIQTIQSKNISNIPEWTGTFYISTGGGKYAPADLPVNDCNGWTHGTAGSYLGSFWLPDQNGGGKGGVAHCGNTRSLACCKNY
jgi:hypothetical protein